ncbi:MAG TPA: AraC family transcriptional regulator [Lachnospiraceae bacterium]|nr:AraC family transcriptional regulator [Lachnospiraceae bacterium]
MLTLNLLKDNSEIVPYNFTHFPVHSTECSLSLYPNLSAASHWHMDLEFITVVKGHMLYAVNGTDYPVKEGECIMVNSRQLHNPHSADNTDCLFHCQLFHPSLLFANENLYHAYVEPVCTDSSMSCILLSEAIDWQSIVISELNRIYEICRQPAAGTELIIMSLLYSIWLSLYKNTMPHIGQKNDRRLETLSQMIGYIQKHYPEKIMLHDIARSGGVSRSCCCNLFSELLNQTPNQYLTGYRLEKSTEMLRHTSLSVTEIALQNGFNSSSYYTEVFHRILGCTPSEYLAKLHG